jgi:hypothetical protein
VIAAEAAMDTSTEMTGKEKTVGTMTPEQAFAGLQEWVTEHGNALTGISAVEAVREIRDRR